MRPDTSTQRYALLALLAAALFGASTPVAKQLIGSADPVLLAGDRQQHDADGVRR
jgi:hypothetical protein